MKYFECSFNNGLFCLNMDDPNDEHNISKYKVRVVGDSPNEDWKTFMALKQNHIPSGTEFRDFRFYNNLYGTYVNVDFEGHTYSLKPVNLILIKKQDFTIIQVGPDVDMKEGIFNLYYNLLKKSLTDPQEMDRLPREVREFVEKVDTFDDSSVVNILMKHFAYTMAEDTMKNVAEGLNNRIDIKI